MRRLPIAAVLVWNLAAVASAAEELRLEGVAFTEGAAEEVRIQVWALGEQVAEHPEWQFKAIFEDVVAPGKAFSAGLVDARLPVLVELSAEGHGDISLEVVLDEQRTLPPAWLRTGAAVSMTVSSAGSSTEQVVVWGEVSADSWHRYRRRWRSAVAHRAAAPGETFEVLVPPTSSWMQVLGVSAEGDFKKQWVRLSKSRPRVRLDLATLEVTVKVWDDRGRPASGVRMVEAGSPLQTAATTGEEGRASVRVPATGQWKIVALTDDLMGTVRGRGRPDGDVEIALEDRTDLTLSWSAADGPLVIDPLWLPPALGGTPRVLASGSAAFPKPASSGRGEFWSPTVAYGSFRFDKSVDTVPLKTRRVVHLDGRVVTTDGRPAPWRPVWIRLKKEDYVSYPKRRESEQPLHRPWLPWAVSGADGRFSVAGLPPSDLQAEVRAPGMPTARGERLSGQAGAALETTVVLRPGATLAFRVTDPTGVPLEGTTADVDRSSSEVSQAGTSLALVRTRKRGDPELSGTTDAEGRVVLTPAPVGVVRLRLSRSGSVTRTFDGIEIRPEGTDLGDLVLEPGVTLRGRTVGPDGRPVGGAEVAMDTKPRMRSFSAITSSDDDGVFAIPDLEISGVVYLQARVKGLVPATPLAVEMPPEGDVEVPMATERRLEGVVLDARDDSPVAGARLRLTAHSAARFGSSVTRYSRGIGNTDSDSSGAFVFDGLAGGADLELMGSADGLRKTVQQVSIPAGADPAPVVLRLEPGLELRGRVATVEGEPASGLRVIASPATQVSPTQARAEYSVTTTDDLGSFRFDDLAPGQVAVQAQSEDGRVAQTVAEAGQSEEVELRFERGEMISGVVLDPEGGPVRGADVWAAGECAQGSMRDETSADGRFELSGAKAGPCHFTVIADGYAGVTKDIEVPGGGLSDLEFRLEQGSAVSGQIRGVGSSQLEGCVVFSDDGARVRVTIGGGFRFPAVRPGEREITAFLAGSDRSRTVRVTVPEAGETDPVIIDFASGITLSGRVLRSGNGVPGLIVQAGDLASRTSGSALSGPAGGWRIEGLDPGEFLVTVLSRSGDVVAGDRVLLEVDTELDLEIPSGRLAGWVVEADSSRPVEGAAVSVAGSGLPPMNRRLSTDASGFFEAFDLADGDYAVRAEARGWSPVQEVVTLHGGVAAELTLSLGSGETTVLVVRNPDGSPPSAIGILSASGGVLGSFITVSCSAAGRCELTELPAGRWTLLVMSTGVALVEVDAPSDEVPITLRRPGELAMKVAADDAGVSWKVRLSDAASGIVMPVSEWLNPGRGEWVPVPASGLTVGLPEGSWRIEAVAPDGTQSIREATVTASATTEVMLDE